MKMYYIMWLIYLYRAIDFLFLFMNQKVASDYWLVNLHVFYLHCISQLLWFLFFTYLSTWTHNTQTGVYILQSNIYIINNQFHAYLVIFNLILNFCFFVCFKDLNSLCWTELIYLLIIGNTVQGLDAHSSYWKKKATEVKRPQRQTEKLWQCQKCLDLLAVTCRPLALRINPTR